MPGPVERFEAVTAVLAGMMSGAIVGVVGSGFHRVTAGSLPVGVVAAVAAVLLGAVFMRALAGRGAYATYAVTVLAMVGAIWFSSDRIVVGEGVGLGWGIGATLACAAGAFLPERWFDAD